MDKELMSIVKEEVQRLLIYYCKENFTSDEVTKCVNIYFKLHRWDGLDYNEINEVVKDYLTKTRGDTFLDECDDDDEGTATTVMSAADFLKNLFGG